MGRSVRSWENPARRERALHGEIEVWTELGGGRGGESEWRCMDLGGEHVVRGRVITCMRRDARRGRSSHSGQALLDEPCVL